MKDAEFKVLRAGAREIRESGKIIGAEIKTVGGKFYKLAPKELSTFYVKGNNIEFTDKSGQEWILEKQAIASLKLIPSPQAKAEAEAAATSQK